MRNTKLILLLLAALLIGMCAGFYINSAIIRARIRAYNQIPANIPQHVTDRLSKRLDLTPEQCGKILATMQGYQARMDETREKSRAMFDELMAEVFVQIDQHLTPEQQAEHARIQDEISAKRRAARDMRRALTPPPKDAPRNNKTPRDNNK